MLRARQSITELKERAAELTGRLGNSDTLIDTLREQLAVKDKHIAKQAEQITQLIARLGTFGTMGGAA